MPRSTVRLLTPPFAGSRSRKIISREELASGRGELKRQKEATRMNVREQSDAERSICFSEGLITDLTGATELELHEKEANEGFDTAPRD